MLHRSRLFAPVLVSLILMAASLQQGCTISRAQKSEDCKSVAKKIVLVAGDEEYRSEEALPQFARILEAHHGFDCTVLFPIDPKDGTVNPGVNDNIPGLEALESADLLVLFTRFRDLPDDQAKHLIDYIESGRPIVAMRTATHAFFMKKHKTYAKYSWNNKEWDGGFGRQVLGETWVSHHGHHGKESTRGVLVEGMESHPILRGFGDVWGPTDVYTVTLPLPDDSTPLVLGQVLTGMSPDDKPLAGPKNNPMMPVAWTKTYTTKSGKKARTFTTTMGASQDFESVGLRRLLVNACYWGLELEDKIPAESDVSIVGKFAPTPFGFSAFQKGLRPEDF